jgi:hypothetical protein
MSIPSNTADDNDTTGSNNKLYYNQLLEPLRQEAFDEKLPIGNSCMGKTTTKQQQSLNGTRIIKDKLSRVHQLRRRILSHNRIIMKFFDIKIG